MNDPALIKKIELDAQAALPAARSTAWLSQAASRGAAGAGRGGSIICKVSLHSPEEVDAEVVEWLRQAYERAR